MKAADGRAADAESAWAGMGIEERKRLLDSAQLEQASIPKYARYKLSEMPDWLRNDVKSELAGSFHTELKAASGTADIRIYIIPAGNDKAGRTAILPLTTKAIQAGLEPDGKVLPEGGSESMVQDLIKAAKAAGLTIKDDRKAGGMKAAYQDKAGAWWESASPQERAAFLVKHLGFEQERADRWSPDPWNSIPITSRGRIEEALAAGKK